MDPQRNTHKKIKELHTSLSQEHFLELKDEEHSLIVLEIPIKDYALSEIARLVEDNNAKIIRLEVVPIQDNFSFIVSMKMDVTDISAILRSFERYHYNIIYYYMKEGEINDTYNDRFDELMHYLDM